MIDFEYRLRVSPELCDRLKPMLMEKCSAWWASSPLVNWGDPKDGEEIRWCPHVVRWALDLGMRTILKDKMGSLFVPMLRAGCYEGKRWYPSADIAERWVVQRPSGYGVEVSSFLAVTCDRLRLECSSMVAQVCDLDYEIFLDRDLEMRLVGVDRNGLCDLSAGMFEARVADGGRLVRCVRCS